MVVLADDGQKEELLSCGIRTETNLVSIDAPGELSEYRDADAIIDLTFDATVDRIDLLKNFSRALVIINSVTHTLQQMNVPFVRINAWPGFLQRVTVEASATNEEIKQDVENIFACFNKKTCWVDDHAGFVTARVVAMIINEAWFALEEKVSTKKEIDVAMKLGTNYPLGPFEWCDKIGPKNIYGLLNQLAQINQRYEPASLLKKEASAWH